MCKSKKFMAIALVATMVFGSSLTAFAEDPVTSGGSDGAGASEGHLEKKVVKVVLPTTEGTTPFNYTMDPERLIRETSGAKYSGKTFPAAEGDTGVYFLTAENTYANKSGELTVTNESSCDVVLSVKVKTTASAGGKDIALAESSTVATTGDPNLYLGLKVGDETTVVSATEQTISTTIEGVSSNFETAVKEGAYVYQVKSDAAGWKSTKISMEGAVSNLPIAADVTAPTVNVTWSFAEAPTDAAPSITTASVTAAANTDAVWTYSLGAGSEAATTIKSITYNGASAISAFDLTTAGQIKLDKATVNSVMATPGSYTYTVTFDDEANTTGTFTLVVQ